MPRVEWLDEPESHDYDAAVDYLSLLMPELAAARVAEKLELPGQSWDDYIAAKDVMRASGLPLLPEDNRHVVKDLKKIEDGERISPVLLVRGDAQTGRPLIVADGYHRICAVYHLDEDAVVKARVTDL